MSYATGVKNPRALIFFKIKIIFGFIQILIIENCSQQLIFACKSFIETACDLRYEILELKSRLSEISIVGHLM